MIPKFRAWDKRKNVMRDVAVLHFTKNGKTNSIEYWINPTELKSYHVRNIDLMQSTGLKDKNGVEIFEGDVVLVSVQNGFDYLDNKVCIVKNSIDYSGLVCATVDEDLEYRIFNTELFEEYTYEVIGNIYENSELLGTMPKIFAIKADSDDQGWMDSFNGWNDSNYSLNQKIDEKEAEVLESKIDKFNQEVACGPAIRLEEQ